MFKNKDTDCVIFAEIGKEPPDAMSLHYADTSLPDFFGRSSLRYAVMSMCNTSKCTWVIQEVFFKLVF